MIAVDQDRFGREGNCLQAAIASILGLPLTAVPDTTRRGFSDPLRLLLETMNLRYIEVPCGPLRRLATDSPRCPEIDFGWAPIANGRVLAVISGPSPRENGIDHAVVGRTNGWGFELVHDPHPSRVSVPYMTSAGFFVAIDPAP